MKNSLIGKRGRDGLMAVWGFIRWGDSGESNRGKSSDGRLNEKETKIVKANVLFS